MSFTSKKNIQLNSIEVLKTYIWVQFGHSYLSFRLDIIDYFFIPQSNTEIKNNALITIKGVYADKILN